MAQITVTSPNGSTTFSVDASWVARLLQYAADIDPALDAAGKEAWVRRQMFVAMRKNLLEHERQRAKSAAGLAVDAMPIVEV